MAIRIWFGAAFIDGEEQDRAPGWRCEIDGRTDHWERDAEGYRCRVPLDVDQVWPYCARDPITQEEYEFLKAHAGWAKEHAPDHPKAEPRKAVDFANMKLPF